MLTHSIRLALLAFLPFVIGSMAVTTDPVLSVRLAALPVACVLIFSFCQQWNLNLEINRGMKDRARYVPWRPTTTIDQKPAPVQPENSPNNRLEQPLHASRSVVLNANGQTGQLSLEPASNELVTFLDTCIRISSADALRFPPVLDLKHIGVPYEQQDAMFALLGEAVIRKDRRPTIIKNGYTLGDLRKFAAGGDLFR